jgi:hypothetical protein
MWIRTAWQHISPEVAVDGFKYCCLINAMDGNVTSVYDKDEATDCEDVDRDTDW